MSAQKILHKAWIVFVGIILIRGFAGGGINNTSGQFLEPASKDIGVGVGSLSIYFSITSIVLVLFLPIAGKLIRKYDIRILVIVGAALQALSFAALGFMNNLWMWYILAIPQAIGAVLIVNLLGPILINRWFSKNIGRMLGIQMACVSVFSAFLQPATANIIANFGWRSGYIYLGGATFLVAVFAAIFLIRNKPEDYGLSAYGGREQTLNNKASAVMKDNVGSPVPQDNTVITKNEFFIDEKTAVKSLSFYLLLFFMISITGVAVFMQHIPTYGRLIGFTTEQVGIALAFLSIGNAIGSIAIGIIADKIGGFKTCYGIIAIGVLSVIGFIFSSSQLMIFMISTFLYGLTISSIMVLAPILTLAFYGNKDYESIYAKVAMGAPLASIFLIPIYGFVYDFMNNYFPVLIFLIVLLILATICISFAWKNRCTINGCPTWQIRRKTK